MFEFKYGCGLCLGGNRIGVRGVRVLVRCDMARLEKLWLSIVWVLCRWLSYWD